MLLLVDPILVAEEEEVTEPVAVTLVTADGESRTRVVHELPPWPACPDRLTLLVWLLWGDEAQLEGARHGLSSRELRYPRLPSDEEARAASQRLGFSALGLAVRDARRSRIVNPIEIDC